MVALAMQGTDGTVRDVKLESVKGGAEHAGSFYTSGGLKFSLKTNN